jgi:organic radical activating enzyme
LDYNAQVKQKLDSISSTFCLAKWTTVTFHLESGTTHSCHHPKVHEIPLVEIEENPAAIHNTSFKVEQREKMINGQRPEECAYCWNIEDLETKELSDRFIKSSAAYSFPELEKIVNDPYSKVLKPKYVEVSFSNVCQFKCSYCSADYSTSWDEEIKKFGNYSTNSGIKTSKSFNSEDENPYVKAFWKWWPELKVGLHTFRITGGEPLLSPSTFKVFESLLENPEPNLNLAINTNLGAPPVLIEKFINLAEKISTTGSVKKFSVYTSIDAYGKRADYIRNGLNQITFWENIEKVLSCRGNFQITIMSTFNALSITSYLDLLKKIMEINLKYRNEERKLPVYLDISYLRFPLYQTVQILTDDYILEMEKIVQFINDNQWQKTKNHVGFHEDQIIKSKRTLEWMRQKTSKEEKVELQKQFYSFFSEHDIRRKTNFNETFPEMKKFWNHCKSL